MTDLLTMEKTMEERKTATGRDLVHCPICGEDYSSSYDYCPFCEEEGVSDRKIRYKPKRRIADKKQARSAKGALIGAGVLVVALLCVYLFGDKLFHGGQKANDAKKNDKPPVSQNEPAMPVSGVEPGLERDTPPEGGDQTETQPDATGEQTTQQELQPETPPEVQPETPPADTGVDVSGAKLNRDDFTLGYAGEKFTMRLSGTEAAPRQWSIDNPNVATITGEGVVTAVANGDTVVRCQVGARELTCKVRVRNTGKTAPAAAEPMVATPIVPTAPAAPTTQPETPPAPTPTPAPDTSNTTVSGTLRVKTNVTGELPKDPDTKTYDCTVSIGNPDSLRLIVYDDSGKELSVNWSSSDTGVATISGDGRITTVGRGRVTMTATVGGQTVKCIIRVTG